MGSAAALVALAFAVPARASAGGAQAQLAARYAPVLRLVAQAKPCAHGEPYEPTNVDLVLGNPDVALRGPWDGSNVVRVAPTAADLARGLWGYHLDFPGRALSPGCDYDTWSHRLNQGRQPVTYARVATDRAYPGELALQYWFFYVFNDFNDKHEGDWEMIQLDFDAASAAQALATTPSLVGYSQHQGAESARWGDPKLQLVDGTHPVVYPALGSHANYYTSALHLGRSAAEGVGCDDTSGPSRQLRPQVALVPSGKAAALAAYPWLGYEGHWGEGHEGFYDGPTGPNTDIQWTQPLAWAARDWRDRSFTVPLGTDVGQTATGFFCTVVATGSGLLTALVGNPSPFLVALLAIVALLLWLVSRTSWRPSAPLRLARRRSWGSILAAARRMYFGNLRLFIGIGLLFLPLSVVISAVQYATFRAGGLSGLVASAGRTNAAVEFLAVGLGLAFVVFGLSVVQSVTALAMSEIDAGRKVTPLAAYRVALPRLGSLLGAVLLVAVSLAVVSFTAAGTVVAAYLVVRWSLLAQVHVLEDRSGLAALRRSARLVGGNWWRVASLILFVTIVALLIGPVCGTLLLFATQASFDFVDLVAGVVNAVVVPFATIATTYLYWDLRVAKQNEPADASVLPEETVPAS